MLTKRQFINFIRFYQEFSTAVDRFDKAITGKSYSTILFEADWYNSVGKLLDIFLESHFNEDGQDLVTWWLFEDVDHTIYHQPDLFSEGKKIEYDVNKLEDLWEYLIMYKEDYFNDE